MRVLSNFELTNYNAYKLKAKCARAYFPDTEKDIVNIYSQKHPLDKRIILGGGNNIILSKSYYNEEFIIFNDCFNKIEIKDTKISAMAGATTVQLSELALKHELTGVEIFYDIPSTVGGAVVMNAGAKGEEIKDVLEKVRYLDLENMQVKEIVRDDINFDYRNSFFQKHSDKIVLKAWFNLKRSDFKSIQSKMEEEKQKRWLKQPRDLPNCGSVFKRPKGHYVGEMIESLGLKGYTIGGAKISEQHAGFIVNFNNATGKDIINLINLIKTKIKAMYKIDLEIEQKII